MLSNSILLWYAVGAVAAVLGFQVYMSTPGSIYVFKRLTIGQALYNVFLSPIRRIPGPLIAKITPYWLVFVDLAGHRTTTLHELHRKYGPSLRVGPNEVSYSNVEVIKEIYGQQTEYMKAPVYDSMTVPPGGIFSFRNKKEHSQRRRLLSHAFSQANLFDTEPLIREHIKTFLALIRPKSGKAVDIFTIFRSLSFDIVGKRSKTLLEQPDG